MLDALPDENYPDVRNGFERMAEVMAAIRERNIRQEGEFMKLREALMQRGNNAVLEGAGGDERQGAPNVAGKDDGRVKLALPCLGGENEMVNGEVARGASTYRKTECNCLINEERTPKVRRQVENIGYMPTQETRLPVESDSADCTSKD